MDLLSAFDCYSDIVQWASFIIIFFIFWHFLNCDEQMGLTSLCPKSAVHVRAIKEYVKIPFNDHISLVTDPLVAISAKQWDS